MVVEVVKVAEVDPAVLVDAEQKAVGEAMGKTVRAIRVGRAMAAEAAPAVEVVKAVKVVWGDRVVREDGEQISPSLDPLILMELLLLIRPAAAAASPAAAVNPACLVRTESAVNQVRRPRPLIVLHLLRLMVYPH